MKDLLQKNFQISNQLSVILPKPEQTHWTITKDRKSNETIKPCGKCTAVVDMKHRKIA